jgi:anaerobic selenocysteine-containing dehydrogenase
VAEEQVEELARAFAAARVPFIRLGSGLSRYGNGAMTVRTIACLPALTGAYGRPGGGCFPGTSTGAAFPLERITREDLLPGPSRIVNMNRLGHALTELDDPPVMALYVYHSNPAAIAPDQNAVLRGLARPELFTVVHERFMTDTARWADLVLPATSSLEHADLYRSYGSYSLQRAGAVIPPVGESRSNWQVFSSLAKRMGFDDPLFHATAEELVELLLSSPSPWRDDIDRGRLEQGEAVRLVPPPSAGSYDTPSGRIEILNPRAAEPLPRFIPGHGEEGGAYPLSLMTAPSLFCLNSSFNEQEELRRRQEGMLLLLNPEDARSRSISEGDPVVARNDLGEVRFTARPTDRVPAGIAVAEGVWWLSHAPGARTVNALTSQRLTDLGEGSTFYDNRVEVQRDAVP